MSIKYDSGMGELKNWLVEETQFDPLYQGKCEVIMSQGNGYLGLRSATEENYVGQTRNMFIAGTFNKFDRYEVTELPNTADVTNIEIFIDKKRFTLEQGKTHHYSRTLNLKNGELTRKVTWEDTQGKMFEFCFRRFVSLDNLHLLGLQVEIKPVNATAEIEIRSGIDAQMSNSGAQHFHEGEKRIYDKKFVELLQTTTETNIDMVL